MCTRTLLAVMFSSSLLSGAARGQGHFAVEDRGPAVWEGSWTMDQLTSLSEELQTQLGGELGTDEPKELLATLNRLSPELRRGVVYGGEFAGYRGDSWPLYTFRAVVGPGADPPGGSNEAAVREWLEERLDSRAILVTGSDEVTHPAAAVIVGYDEELGARIDRLNPGDPVFGEDAPEALQRYRFRARFGGERTESRYFSMESRDRQERREPLTLEGVEPILSYPGVLRVTRDYSRGPEERIPGGRFSPNDEYYATTQQWHLWSIGARFAWRHVRVSPAVVAVIDTGVALAHPDLAGNLWMDPADGAGVDFTDLAGGPPEDTDGHGTHVAGIIAAVSNNSVGISGVAWAAEIMALRIAETSDKTDDVGVVEAMVQAIDYAIDHGADIINLSYVLFADYEEAEQVFVRADAADVLVVASSGNAGQKAWPANYDLKNILSVMSVDRAYNVVDRSDVDPVNVDIAAPGQAILSTKPGDLYQTETGTSMATAVVSGAAALLMGHPDYAAMTPEYLIAELTSPAHVFQVPALAGKCVSGGVIDLAFVGPPATDPPTDQSAAPTWDILHGKLEFLELEDVFGQVKKAGFGAVVCLYFTTVNGENAVRALDKTPDDGFADSVVLFGRAMPGGPPDVSCAECEPCEAWMRVAGSYDVLAGKLEFPAGAVGRVRDADDAESYLEFGNPSLEASVRALDTTEHVEFGDDVVLYGRWKPARQALRVFGIWAE